MMNVSILQCCVVKKKKNTIIHVGVRRICSHTYRQAVVGSGYGGNPTATLGLLARIFFTLF